MDLRIRRVFKLQGHKAARYLRSEFTRFFDGAFHAFVSRSQYQIGPEHCHQPAPFNGHGLRHGQDQLVSARGAGKSQSYARIAAGGFNHHAAGPQFSLPPGGGKHGRADTALDAGQGIEGFDFAQNNAR